MCGGGGSSTVKKPDNFAGTRPTYIHDQQQQVAATTQGSGASTASYGSELGTGSTQTTGG